MNLIIKINLDNAAFETFPGTEIADTLRRLEGQFRGIMFQNLMVSPLPAILRDSNGNQVGTVEVTE